MALKSSTSWTETSIMPRVKSSRYSSCGVRERDLFCLASRPLLRDWCCCSKGSPSAAFDEDPGRVTARPEKPTNPNECNEEKDHAFTNSGQPCEDHAGELDARRPCRGKRNQLLPFLLRLHRLLADDTWPGRHIHPPALQAHAPMRPAGHELLWVHSITRVRRFVPTSRP
eukprot:scaffold1755_cov202-Prasinococcus_capsulatus_cf.AAC.2